MPGNVQNASPSTVFPVVLCASWSEKRWWTVEENFYALGERQARVLTTTSRKGFEWAVRLSGTALIAARAFLFARRFLEPFYIYIGTETSPKWSHDPTGVVTTGRYTVVARPGWQQEMGPGRGTAQVIFEEVT